MAVDDRPPVPPRPVLTAAIPNPLPWPDPPLRDGVVRLRPWVVEDLDAVVSACADIEIARFSPAIPHPYNESDFHGWLAAQEPTREAGGGIDFAIIRDDHADTDTDDGHAAGELLGAVGLGAPDRQARTASTGYWLAVQARGHGYASRAVRLLVRWAFDDLGFARVWLTNDPENLASQAVARRCGFTLEGRLRSHLVVRYSGERRDSLIWGLLPGELR